MNQILTFVQSQDVFAWVGAVVALLSAVNQNALPNELAHEPTS